MSGWAFSSIMCSARLYNDKMGAVVERLTELDLLEESDGAMVVRLDEEGMPLVLF